MATAKVRTNYGHLAGINHGRWEHRADAKQGAKKRRRREAKMVIKKERNG